MKLAALWIVRDPSPNSELVDVVFEMDVHRLPRARGVDQRGGVPGVRLRRAWGRPMSAACGKRCVKCDASIPPEDVVLAPDVDERCHDCADYCDDPDCAKCAAETDTKE